MLFKRRSKLYGSERTEWWTSLRKETEVSQQVHGWVLCWCLRSGGLGGSGPLDLRPLTCIAFLCYPLHTCSHDEVGIFKEGSPLIKHQRMLLVNVLWLHVVNISNAFLWLSQWSILQCDYMTRVFFFNFTCI